jgi:hypothetical protein
MTPAVIAARDAAVAEYATARSMTGKRSIERRAEPRQCEIGIPRIANALRHFPCQECRGKAQVPMIEIRRIHGLDKKSVNVPALL